MNNTHFARLLLSILLVAIATLLAAGLAAPAVGDEPLPQPETWTAGKTSVSELSPSERKMLLGVPADVVSWEKEQAAILREKSDERVYSFPERIDWRSYEGQDYTTAVRNQLSCGSCVAFGTIAAIESRLEVKTGDPDLNPDLSEDHLFFCGGGDCIKGWYPSEALEFAQTTGIVDESCQPYDSTAHSCNPCADWEDRVTKIASYRNVVDPGEIKEIIATDGPVITRISVYEDFFYYLSGIYRYEFGSYIGSHLVALAGYDDTQGYWIAKNSWGTSWGEDGWFRIAFGEADIGSYVYVPEMYPSIVNQAPLAEGDHYFNPSNIAPPGVLANDRDPDELPEPLTAKLEGNVTHGYLALSADGSFEYWPDPGFEGEDSFTYRAYDGELYSLATKVTIEVTSDPFEPNDSFGTATEIDNPSFLIFDFVAIDPPGDLDYFRFQGRAGDEINFYLDERSPLEAVLSLYDANLRLLAKDNDAAGNNDGVASFVHKLPVNGDYYLRVNDNRHPSAGGEDYTYSLSLYLDQTGEPNDDFTLATPVVYGDLVRAFLFTRFGPDVDIYRFTGQQGDSINARLWADDWSEELHLCLFGPDQTELVCDNALLNYELPSGGSYYLQVTGLYPGNYSLYLWLAAPVDVNEPNDDRFQATPIALDTTVDAALEDHNGVPFWEDQDYYQFSSLVGQSILAVADSAVYGSYVTPDLEIQDAGGNVLDSVRASTTRTELAFTLPSTGLYYVHVSAGCGEGGAGCQGGYQLQVRRTNEAPLSVYLPITVYSPDLEHDALVALYHSTNGDSWTHKNNWLSSKISYCDWYGIACTSEARVKSLDLSNNQLIGPLPPELGALSSLKNLNLSWNQLSGSIPTELENLSRLTSLDLGNNHLNGSIPLGLANLESLTSLNLTSNQLSGSIPRELGNLKNLTYLNLSWNELRGPIPQELSDLSSLASLILALNQLGGAIPVELSNLSNLTYLDLGGNQLSGHIPPQLGKLSMLDDLRLYSNNLTGSIPPELGNLSNLYFVELYGNHLSGPIPHEFSYLKHVGWLRLHDNQLTCWHTQAVLDWALNILDNGERASWDYPNPGEDICGNQAP